jgi:hypothetical protein
VGRFRSQAKYRGNTVTLTQEHYITIARGPCTYCRDFHSTRLRGVDRIDSDGVNIPYNRQQHPVLRDVRLYEGLAASSELLAKANATLYIHKKQEPHDSDRTVNTKRGT